MMSVWTGHSLQQKSSTSTQPSKQISRGIQPKVLEEGPAASANCFGRRSKTSNRRQGSRVATTMEIVMRSLKSKRSRNTPIKAQMTDISSGGVCITMKKPLQVSSVLRCEFKVGDAGVAVPSLMQVRWVEPVKAGGYRCGLLYLI